MLKEKKSVTPLAKDMLSVLAQYDEQINEVIEKRNRFKELILLEDSTLNLHDVKCTTVVKEPIKRSQKKDTVAVGEQADAIKPKEKKETVSLDKPDKFRRFNNLKKSIEVAEVRTTTNELRSHLRAVGFIVKDKKYWRPIEEAKKYMFLGSGYTIQFYEDSFKELLKVTGYVKY